MLDHCTGTIRHGRAAKPPVTQANLSAGINTPRAWENLLAEEYKSYDRPGRVWRT
ncbi:MAG: hypothetical protein J7M26_01390 [Armatimonadetes bacterium]|nr:hypothetical protein [Armatimonadota bacterium]